MTPVHVWRVLLDRPGSFDGVLDRVERQRAARFRDARVRDRFVVAHAALRDILARYVNTDPADLRFTTAANGKPALARGGAHFNLSRSDGVALVAVDRQRPVGVDVEHVRDAYDTDGVADRFFTDEEKTWLRVGGSAGLARFFELWTCKESCLKESGRGVGAIESLSVIPGVGDATGQWRVATFRPAADYVGSVATRNSRLRLQLLPWSPVS